MQSELTAAEREAMKKLKQDAPISWMCSSYPYELYWKYRGYSEIGPGTFGIVDCFKDVDAE